MQHGVDLTVIVVIHDGLSESHYLVSYDRSIAACKASSPQFVI